MSETPGLFDVDARLRRLSDIGDQLESYASVVDFEIFRSELGGALASPPQITAGNALIEVLSFQARGERCKTSSITPG